MIKFIKNNFTLVVVVSILLFGTMGIYILDARGDDEITNEEEMVLGSEQEPNFIPVGYNVSKIVIKRNSDGSTENQIKVGQGYHLNYKEDGEFKSIDKKLVDMGDRWEMKKASYNAVIYKDSSLGFYFKDRLDGKNIDMHFIPDTENTVTGVLDGNDIVFTDLFGSGIHQTIKLTNMGIRKIVQLDNPLEKDLIIRWELVDYNLTKTVENVLSSRSEIVLKDVNGRKTYIEEPVIWDSSPTANIDTLKIEAITWGIDEDNGKNYLRKTIAKNFSDIAIFPIFTDASPYTTSTTSGDSNVRAVDANFTSARNLTIGSDTNFKGPEDNGPICDQFGSEYYIGRAFIPFDASEELTESDTVTATVFHFYNHESLVDSDTTYVNIVGNTTQASPTTLSTADYNQCGPTPSGATMSADNIYSGNELLSGFTLNTWGSIELNANGIAQVSPTSTTMIGMRLEGDVKNSTSKCGTSNGTSNAFIFYSSKGVELPYYVITYGAPASGGPIIIIY